MGSQKNSLRIQFVIFTFISLIAALVFDLLFMITCSKTGFLVENLEEDYLIHSFIMNGKNPQLAELLSQIREYSSVIYKIFGVNFSWQFYVVMFIVSVALFITVFLLLTHPLSVYYREIVDGAIKMSEGHFDERIPVRSDNEFSAVANYMNLMALTVQDMKAKADAAERSKNEMITNIAHDLRTPLTSVLGYIELVKNNENLSEEEKVRYLQIAYDKATKIDHMINEFFDFTKINYSEKPIVMAKIDVISMLSQEIEELYPVFEEHDLECEFVPDRWNYLVNADGELLVRVFDNLLGNAIKYGKAGRRITVGTVSSEDHIEISIINYGDPIPKDDLPYLFDKFYKVDRSRNGAGNSEGTGLGLAIAKSIVEKHNGTIGVTSDDTKTEFSVILPKA